MVRRLGIAAGVLALVAIALYVAVATLLASDAVRTQLEAQLAQRFAQPVRIRSASASIFPRIGIDLGDVTIGDPAAVHIAHLRLATGLRALLSRTVADAEVNLSDGRVVLPLPFNLAPPSSNAAGPGAASALTIASIRVISLKNIVLIAGARSLQVDLESSLAGDRLEVTSFRARAEKTRLSGRGVFTSLARMEGRFDTTADPLDLDEMITIGSAMTAAPERPARAATTSRGGTTTHVVVTMKAPRAHFAGYALRDLSGTIDMASGRFALTPFATRIFGGSISGSLTASTASAVPRLQLDARLNDVNVTELMNGSGSSGGITGTLAGTARLSAEGSDPGRVLRSARGTIDASITDGQLPHLDLVRSVVLAFGKASGAPPQGSGTAFSRAGGTFALTGGVLSSTNLTLSSRDLDMQGHGTLSVESGRVDARADVVLSRDLTAQAGTDLRRYAQQDGRVVVPAVITGTLSQPSVSLDVAAAGRRAVENELQRRLKDAIGGLFKKKGGGLP